MLLNLSRKYSMPRANRKFILISFVIALSACGGGGGGSAAPTPETPSASSDWDSLVWDDDDWG